jgi:hypothetical protein
VGTALYTRDSEPGTTFATRGVDLKINSRAFYNGTPVPASSWHLKNLVPGSDHFFKIKDLKPGDSGKTIISLHVKKTSAWACLDFTNLKGYENGHNEPEAGEDVDGAEGELLEGLEFFAWHDDGDNVYEVGEEPLFGTSTQSAGMVLDDTSYPIADVGSKFGMCREGTTRYIGIAWCAGDLVVNQETAEIRCLGEALGNEAQTDSLSVDVSIRAIPAFENPHFNCDGSTKNPPKTPPRKDRVWNWNPWHTWWGFNWKDTWNPWSFFSFR